jgi:hypothetical protein
MEWNEQAVMAALVVLLLACELAACTALIIVVTRRAWAWAQKRRSETLDRVRGFEVRFSHRNDDDRAAPAGLPEESSGHGAHRDTSHTEEERMERL